MKSRIVVFFFWPLVVCAGFVPAVVTPGEAQAASVSPAHDPSQNGEGWGMFGYNVPHDFDPARVIDGLLIHLTETSAAAGVGQIAGTLLGGDLVRDPNEMEPVFGEPALGGHTLKSNGMDETAAFGFLVTVADVPVSFVAAEPPDFNSIHRLDGMDNDRSGKVAAGNVVPLPSPIALGMFGFVAAAIGARRFRRACVAV